MGPIVAIDVETSDSRGASFEYFRKDFKVFSLSCAWRDIGAPQDTINHWFGTDPTKIRQKLLALSREGARLVAHNLPYEMGVLNAWAKHIPLNWYADTMRLAQVRDGGGDEFGQPTLTLEQEIALALGEISMGTVQKAYNKTKGLSLEACALRFLPPEEHAHKGEAHGYLEEHHGIKRGHGQHLHLLPPDVLERYNNADTRVTLLLFEDHMRALAEIDYDWTRDHALYLMRARLMSGAYYRGIKIDTEALMQYILQLEQEIKDIEAPFMATFADQIAKVARIRREQFTEKYVNDPKLKREESRAKRAAAIEAGKHDDKWRHFNIASNAQLAILFKDVLGITPRFLTEKGAPSFRSQHLNQWGDGGEMLLKRRKRLLVLQQACNTWVAARYDGRVHPSVRVAGTRTNRVSGGKD